jgi:hypothetical protein
MFVKSMIAVIALASSVSFAKGHMKQDRTEVMDKCQSDITTLCAKAKGKHVVQCLNKHSDKIASTDCKDAVAKLVSDKQMKKSAKSGVEAAAPATATTAPTPATTPTH